MFGAYTYHSDSRLLASRPSAMNILRPCRSESRPISGMNSIWARGKLAKKIPMVIPVAPKVRA